MTTLPQTTPLRLPRPAPSGPLTIPGGPMAPAGGMVAQVQAGSQMTGADVWRVIRSNLWLIILMLVVGAASGYGLNYWLKQYHSRYTATGLLQVVAPEAVDLLTPFAVNTSDLLTDLKTHAALLHDTSLVTQVLQNRESEIRSTKWFADFGGNISDLKQDLRENLEVAIQPDSRLLRIAMTYNDPASCQVIVNTVADQYIKNQKELNQNKEYERHRDLENRLVKEEMNLKAVNGEIADKESELNSNGVSGTMNKISAKDMELSQLLQSSLTQQLQLDAANDELASIRRQIDANQDPPKVAVLMAADPDVAMYRQLVNSVELAGSEAMENLGPEHSTVKELQARQKLLEGKLAMARSAAQTRCRMEVLEDANEKVALAQRSLDQMGKRVDTLKGDMAHLTDVMTDLLEKQSEKEGFEAKIRQINDHLSQIDSFSVKHDFSGVDWAARPERPEQPSFPQLKVIMPLMIALGLAIALGVAFLRELLDTSIRSPRDITRVGNMNVLGMIPHEDDDPQSAGARLPVVIFEAPHSMMAEQLRQVRTRLQHSSSLDTTRSILITSPSPGDGKSTIACNLASGLALNGRRILLVDANFRRPELHRIFNLSNEQGFADVLNSLELFESTVQETQVPNLYVLPCGPMPTNATELLESQLLIDFIERALEEFDHVIFDSGPLLVVSETVALAPRVDGVVTVVRARANSRGVLSRMRDSLRQIKAEHLGIVLNAVRTQGGGYYGRNIRTYYEYQSSSGGGRAA